MSTLDFLDTREKRLFALFAGTFHDDWHDYFPTPKLAIDDYIASHGHELLRVVAEELRWLVTQFDDSSKLWDALVDQYGSTYDGGRTGQNAHAWVDSIADQIERALRYAPQAPS